ncbi:hypothetical protein AGLY_013099 [Aphis glycines]|uniref:Uncharacterized protein n=1 Tax=Aphis glycines TaxID=307491 RepID=A0A6G0T7Q4_APHGL|nr:hypothetical protein AGLY_013099 [Aphis glycines]
MTLLLTPITELWVSYNDCATDKTTLSAFALYGLESTCSSVIVSSSDMRSYPFRHVTQYFCNAIILISCIHMHLRICRFSRVSNKNKFDDLIFSKMFLQFLWFLQTKSLYLLRRLVQIFGHSSSRLLFFRCTINYLLHISGILQFDIKFCLAMLTKAFATKQALSKLSCSDVAEETI